MDRRMWYASVSSCVQQSLAILTQEPVIDIVESRQRHHMLLAWQGVNKADDLRFNDFPLTDQEDLPAPLTSAAITSCYWMV